MVGYSTDNAALANMRTRRGEESPMMEDREIQRAVQRRVAA